MNDKEKQQMVADHMNEHFGWNCQAWQIFIIPTREPGVEKVQQGTSIASIGHIVDGVFTVHPRIRPRRSDAEIEAEARAKVAREFA